MNTRNNSQSFTLIEESRMTEATDADIRRLLLECFPEDGGAFSDSRYWHGSGPAYSLLHREGDRLEGHIGIVVRDIRWGTEPVRIAGIQNLAVSPRMRGRGIASALMRASMEEAGRRGIVFGLLFCVPELERYYRSLDWKTLDVPVWMTDEEGHRCSIPDKNIAMALQIGESPIPEGDIDLQGADW